VTGLVPQAGAAHGRTAQQRHTRKRATMSERRLSKRLLSERLLSERLLSERPLSERPLSEPPLIQRPLSQRPLSKRPLSKRPLSKGSCPLLLRARAFFAPRATAGLGEKRFGRLEDVTRQICATLRVTGTSVRYEVSVRRLVQMPWHLARALHKRDHARSLVVHAVT
jgi:hypothetical protein